MPYITDSVLASVGQEPDPLYGYYYIPPGHNPNLSPNIQALLHGAYNMWLPFGVLGIDTNDRGEIIVLSSNENLTRANLPSEYGGMPIRIQAMGNQAGLAGNPWPGENSTVQALTNACVNQAKYAHCTIPRSQYRKPISLQISGMLKTHPITRRKGGRLEIWDSRRNIWL